ncbi:hypothetical protein [Kordia sp.]|uniref:hypothetical protein n=1 Tax=Kordia sp. TaxID=1965332 RepID=UPI003D6AE138
MKKITVAIAIFCITNFAFSQTSNSFSAQDLKLFLNKQVDIKLKNDEKNLDISCTDGSKRVDYVSKISKNYIEVICPERKKNYVYKFTTRILISEISVITLIEKN